MDDDAVLKMYQEEMLSTAQIGERLGVSSRKIDYLLKKNGIVKRSISEAITQVNITKFHKIPFIPKAELSFGDIELKIAGIMLYWGEGAKTNGSVGLANSSPEIIKIFLLFLRNICGVDEKRIKAIIHHYPDQDKGSLLDFWSHVTAIPKERFYRSHLLAGKKGSYKHKSLYGTITVSYCDIKLLRLILKWIGEYSDKFLAAPE